MRYYFAKLVFERKKKKQIERFFSIIILNFVAEIPIDSIKKKLTRQKKQLESKKLT